MVPTVILEKTCLHVMHDKGQQQREGWHADRVQENINVWSNFGRLFLGRIDADLSKQLQFLGGIVRDQNDFAPLQLMHDSNQLEKQKRTRG